jgi:hypothetical protein
MSHRAKVSLAWIFGDDDRLRLSQGITKNLIRAPRSRIAICTTRNA